MLFLIDLQMDENKPLIEESTQSTRTRHNTTWYLPKEGDIKSPDSLNNIKSPDSDIKSPDSLNNLG